MRHDLIGHVDNKVVEVPISPARYEEVRRAKATCFFALEVEEKLALLLDNYADMEYELLRLAENAVIWRNRNNADFMQERLALNRHLVNLLTACRLYLDQTEHGFSTVFGNPSAELEAIRTVKQKLYDDNPGYRFMEALRNHVQHAGLPIDVISHRASRVTGKGPDYSERRVAPQTTVRELTLNPKFKKAAMKGLPVKDGKIDLRAPVREYVVCFFELHKSIRKLLQVHEATARLQYEEAIRLYSTRDGKTVHFPTLLQRGDDGQETDTVALIDEFLSYSDELKKRNTVNDRLRHDAASNSDQER